MAGPLPRSVYRRRRAGVAIALVAVVIGLVLMARTRSADPPVGQQTGDGSTADGSPNGPAIDDGASPGNPNGDPRNPNDPHGDEATTTTWASTGHFEMATGESAVAGTGPVRLYTVEVEDSAGVSAEDFAAEVDQILVDPRGWTAVEGIGLQRVASGEQAAFTVRLSTPDTVDLLCSPLETDGDVSCAMENTAVINTMRWHTGAVPSGLDLTDYRRYLISHEVGHLLGHNHVDCPGAGHLAPVMMQQTLDIGDCAPNPWPDPHAVVTNEAAGG